MKKIKLLYFLTGLKKGGAETQLFNLLSVLSKDKNYEIKVIAFISGPYVSMIRNLGLKVEILFTRNVSIFNIFNIFKMFIFYNKSIRYFKPDIVHSFLYHTNIISKLSLLFNKKTYKLICAHGSMIKKLFLIKNLEYINMVKVDLFIPNSYAANSDLEIYHKYKIQSEVIYNSINKRKIDFSQVKKLKKEFKGKKIILTIANFRSEKDYSTNVETCFELSKKRKDFLFVYVGTYGPEIKVINLLKKKYKLENFISILGVRNDIFELLNISKLFFMPTLFESQSNSIMEAMYMKNPIVSTNIVANQELVKNGFLCKPKDFKNMAKKIELILNGKYKKKWIEANSNFLEKNFSQNIIANKYRKVYKRLAFTNYYEKK